MEIGWKYLCRIWGVPSLFMNFLGIFLCMETGFVTSCVHFLGVPNVFSCWSLCAGDVGMTGGVTTLASHIADVWAFPALPTSPARTQFGLGSRDSGRGGDEGKGGVTAMTLPRRRNRTGTRGSSEMVMPAPSLPRAPFGMADGHLETPARFVG